MDRSSATNIILEKQYGELYTCLSDEERLEFFFELSPEAQLEMRVESVRMKGWSDAKLIINDKPYLTLNTLLPSLSSLADLITGVVGSFLGTKEELEKMAGDSEMLEAHQAWLSSRKTDPKFCFPPSGLGAILFTPDTQSVHMSAAHLYDTQGFLAGVMERRLKQLIARHFPLRREIISALPEGPATPFEGTQFHGTPYSVKVASVPDGPVPPTQLEEVAAKYGNLQRAVRLFCLQHLTGLVEGPSAILPGLVVLPDHAHRLLARWTLEGEDDGLTGDIPRFHHVIVRDRAYASELTTNSFGSKIREAPALECMEVELDGLCSLIDDIFTDQLCVVMGEWKSGWNSK